MGEYRPVTVAAAKAIAAEFDKDVVVLVAMDHAHGKTHYTTYGRAPQDKLLAIDLGAKVWAVLHTPAEQAATITYEDFRLDAAKNRARVEELEDRLARLRAVVGPGPAGGDVPSQARAWAAVYQECRALGMHGDTVGPGARSGVEHVLDFVRELVRSCRR